MIKLTRITVDNRPEALLIRWGDIPSEFFEKGHVGWRTGETCRVGQHPNDRALREAKIHIQASDDYWHGGAVRFHRPGEENELVIVLADALSYQAENELGPEEL